MAKRHRERYQGDLAGDAKEFVPNQANSMIASGNRWYNASMFFALLTIIGVLVGMPAPLLVLGLLVAIVGLWQAKTQTKKGKELKREHSDTTGASD